MSVLRSTAAWSRTLHRACHGLLPVKSCTPPVAQWLVPHASVKAAQRQASKLSIPHSHLPYGQSGSGHYGKWLGDQSADNIAVIKDKILEIVDLIPAESGNNADRLFTIGDYGTADGAVSMSLLRDLIAHIRTKHGEIPIQIMYEDQSSNDFNSVFKRVHGLIPDPPTYLNDFQQVYVTASGTSFYDQVIPDNSAHLIMCFTAIHWLSRRPTTFQNSLNRFPYASEEERKLLADQAAEDWERFLVQRAKELKPGGVLVLSLLSATTEPNERGVKSQMELLLDDMLTVWRSMRDEKKITEDEFVNTNFNFCNRYPEEIHLPFEDKNSPVTKAGLRLINAEQILHRNLDLIRWQEKLEKEGVDDRETYANTTINQSRVWSNSTFMAGLSNTRSHNEKEALVDELFQRMEAKVAACDPRDLFPVKHCTPPVTQWLDLHAPVMAAQLQASKLSVPHSHLPYGQSGSGHYGFWQCDQGADYIAVIKDKILEVVDLIPAQNGNNADSLFTIGDYGTADGAVSMSLLRDLIAHVRKKHGEIPIQIVYEDQASNDFNSVFKRVHGLIPDPPTYLNDFRQVYVMASGTSFYDQVIPDNTAHLIMSFVSAHWLSRSEEERKLLTDQAAEDWERFLVLRAKELKPGGVLVVSLLSATTEPNEGGVTITCESLYDDMLTVWRSMRDEGKLTEDEFVNTNFNFCFRYPDEIQLPFQVKNSPVTKAGLRLIDAKQILCRNLALNKWQEKLEKEGVDDSETYAKTTVSQARLWVNSTFMAGLSNTRSHNEKEALVDELFQRIEAKVAARDPRENKNFRLLYYVFAQKV